MVATKTKTKKQAIIESQKSLVTSSLTNYSLSDFGNRVVINNSQLYDLYRQNPDIRQAVRKKSQYVGKKGFILKDWKDEAIDNKEQPEAYKAMKRILANPTIETTKLYMMRDFDVVGEVFIAPTFNAFGEISGLHIVDPRMVQKNITNGIVTGYTQYANYWAQGTTNTVQYTSDPEKATMRLPLMCSYMLEKHIKSEFMGMGLLESVVWDALSDLEASKRNYYFFQNNMTPPSMFLLDKDVSENEINILREQLVEQYRGSQNSHKPLIGAWVEDVKVLSVSPKDMEHINQKKMTIDKVSACFGVPKFILWYTEDVNLSNGDGMRREFISGTVEPYQALFDYVLSDLFQKCNQAKSFIKLPKELLVKGTRNYTICFVSDDIDQDMDEDKVRLEKLKNGVLTINEYREEDWLAPFTDNEYANKPLVPKTVVPLEDIAFAYTPNMNE